MYCCTTTQDDPRLINHTIQKGRTACVVIPSGIWPSCSWSQRFRGRMRHPCACRTSSGRWPAARQPPAVSRSPCASPPSPSRPRSTRISPRTTTRSRPIEQMFLGLTNINNETAAIEPELAESWTVSEDGTVWTFKLRQDAMWSDGKPVTAQGCGVQRQARSQAGNRLALCLRALHHQERPGDQPDGHSHRHL